MEDITFGSKDLEGVSYPHDDALVITANVANFEVKKLSTLELELEHHMRLAPVEELVEVELEPGKRVIVGQDLEASLRGELIGCLSRYDDAFTWNVEDMPLIDPKIVIHKLNVNFEARQV
ncbi:unnamed protein product [Fraxinus pennsylvanica]|uniref:Uncharacterized protein n=1 Tax=Fraxinus pennsylvanica TaxID=56036 RepID=A0AAD1ZM26_9LAMI|nr:unnamed protein product [Fraxinus pennsylvanica]